MVQKEPKSEKGSKRLFKAARVPGTTFGVMIDAIVQARPKARELVRNMTKDLDEPLDPRAEQALDEMAAIVLAKKEVQDDFGQPQDVPIFDTKSRISAAKVLLEFTKQKPKTVNQNVEMTTEEWLESLPDGE